jgi:hypothetical protein
VRFDQVVLSATGVVSRLAGTENTTATLDNETGAAALPTGTLLLANALVTPSGVSNTNIRDRRTWARGFFYVRNDLNGHIDPTGVSYPSTYSISFRAELSGAPIEISVGGSRELAAASTAAKAAISVNSLLHFAPARGLKIQLADVILGRSTLAPPAYGTVSAAETRVIPSPPPGSYLITLSFTSEVPASQNGTFDTPIYDGMVSMRELVGQAPGLGAGTGSGSGASGGSGPAGTGSASGSTTSGSNIVGAEGGSGSVGSSNGG